MVGQLRSLDEKSALYKSFLKMRKQVRQQDKTIPKIGEDKMKVSFDQECPTLSPCDLQNHEFQIDPYVGCEHYCYYCYVLGQAKTDWTNEILTHPDMLDRLDAELSGIRPQTIYLGWHTDPYQPCEKVHCQTRKILELLLDKGFSASILTKSDLVLRDLDILKQMEKPSVSMSFAFNDNKTRKLFEHHTMKNEDRLDALTRLSRNKIRTAALVCPVIPYISDAASWVEALAPVTELIWIYGLSIMHMSGPNWKNVEQILSDHFPDKKGRIEKALFSRTDPYWERLRAELEILQKESGVNLEIHV